MNIFIFDKDLETNVKMYCASYTSKMLLETAQLLSTAYRVLTEQLEGERIGVYKLNHLNHPCSKWARASYGNYAFLLELFYALHDEWNYKFEHDKIHKSYEIFEVLESIPPFLFPEQKQQEFVQCFDDKYKHPNPVIGYRNYFNAEKQHLFKWKNREVPTWVQIKKN